MLLLGRLSTIGQPFLILDLNFQSSNSSSSYKLGLCHGVAGNAYALLRIYQVTHDEKYLHRAFALAEYCADFGNGNLKHAEQYTSLFEGIILLWNFLSYFMTICLMKSSFNRTCGRTLSANRSPKSTIKLLSRIFNLQLKGRFS